MLKVSNIFNFLKRKTNSVNFIPQIDGLRFLAILPVIIGHLNVFVNAKTALSFNRSPFDYWFINIINSEARKGVLLFFVISGFILAVPFVKQFLYEGKAFSLKSYFLRRLTRLEVPYIFNNIVYALLLVFFASHEYSKTFSVDIVLKHLMASLLYIHNFIFVDHRINYVTWSLEIEIQFYILVPLIILLFKLSKKLRRAIIIFLILLFPLLQHYYTPHFLSIYNFIQYFLIGFVLVDLFLVGFKFNLNKWAEFLIGFLSLLCVLFLNIENNFYAEYCFIVLLSIFTALVLMGEVWRKVFSIKFLTVVGGMCYSIYLWHTAIISGLGNYITHIGISGHYFITLFLQSLIILPAVLVFSTIVYVLIEKPCMDKNWPVKLWCFMVCKYKTFNLKIRNKITGYYLK